MTPDRLVPEPTLRDLMGDLVARAHRLEPDVLEDDDARAQYALGKADAYRGVVAELEDLIGSLPAQRAPADRKAAG